MLCFVLSARFVFRNANELLLPLFIAAMILLQPRLAADPAGPLAPVLPQIRRHGVAELCLPLRAVQRLEGRRFDASRRHVHLGVPERPEER